MCFRMGETSDFALLSCLLVFNHVCVFSSSLVFSLFPPSTDIVRRDTLCEGVHNDFGAVDWLRKREHYN